MLTPFREILEERRAAGAAVGAFTCYDVTTAIGVVRAAEARGDPVLLLDLRGLVPVALRAGCSCRRSWRSPTRRASLRASSSTTSTTSS